MKYRKTILFILIMLPNFLIGQHFMRIKGEYSIKSKAVEGNQNLIMGTFYYDKLYDKLVYDTKFPEQVTWVSNDTSMYKIIDGQLAERTTIMPVNEFLIYHMVLNGDITNFGLDKTGFSIAEVEEDAGMVITTWQPPKAHRKVMGNVLISVKEGKLFGIVFLNAEGSVIKKQFFEDYQNISGINFPLTITEITIAESGESYQVTTYKNVAIDDPTEDDIYNYDINF